MLLKLDVLRSPDRLQSGAAHWATPDLFKGLAWSLVALLAAALAWTWIAELQQSRPAAEPAARPRKIDLAAEIDNAASTPLFGLTTMASPASAPPLDVKLKGVFAGEGERLGAIVNTGGQDRFIEVGRDIGPSLRLASVHSSYIVVERNGVKQRVDLGRLESSSAGRRPAAPPAAAPVPPQALPENASPAPQTNGQPPAQPIPPGMAPPPSTPLPENPSPSSAPAAVSGLARRAAWA
jgi:general secretion pathway protein C